MRQDEEKNETREVNQSNLNLNLSPFEQKIDESLSQENEKRIEHLKKFNYSFSNSRRVDELEKQPAKVGIDLEESFQKSDQENSSRILLMRIRMKKYNYVQIILFYMIM